MTATDLHDIYLKQGSSIFIRTRPWLRPYGLGWAGWATDKLFTKYKADGLERLLQEKLGEGDTVSVTWCGRTVALYGC